MRISDWSSEVCASDLLAFEINLGALLQIALGHTRQPFIEDRDGVPFGAFLPLAGVLVLPAFAGRAPQLAALAAVLERAHFRVRSAARRVGKECVSTGRSWWPTYHKNQIHVKNN